MTRQTSAAAPISVSVRRRRTIFKGCAAAMALALSACAGTTTPPVTPGQAGAITAQESQYGAEAHPQLLAEFGGRYDCARSPITSSGSARTSPRNPDWPARATPIR